MKVKFTLHGLGNNLLLPKDIDADIKFQHGDKIWHVNNTKHIEYRVVDVSFVLDDLKGEFYQDVGLSPQES